MTFNDGHFYVGTNTQPQTIISSEHRLHDVPVISGAYLWNVAPSCTPEGYKAEMVEKILRAKKARRIKVPQDHEEFLAWANTPQK